MPTIVHSVTQATKSSASFTTPSPSPGLQAQGSIDWKLVIEFVRIIVWPVFVLLVLWIFRKTIKELVQKLTKAQFKDLVIEFQSSKEKKLKSPTEITGWYQIELGAKYWSTYDEMWKCKGYSKAVEDEARFKYNVEQAIEESKKALEFVRKQEDENLKDLLIIAKNNLAYNLATRRASFDKPFALQLAQDVYVASEGNYNNIETYCWVLLRFADIMSTEEQKKQDIAKAEKIIKALVNDPKLTDKEWKKEVKTCYTSLFGITFE